jgi:hypothetical protein
MTMGDSVSVNLLAVLIAAIAAWIAGAIWYGVFGTRWVAALGRTMEDFKREQAARSGLAAYWPFILAFVANLIVAYTLARLMLYLDSATIRGGIVSAALCWLGFVVTTMSVNNAFGGRKAALTAIDSGHWLLAMIVSGAVIGAFGL